MSITKILGRLRKESAACKHQRSHTDVPSSPGFMDGTVNGLVKAIQIVEEGIEEERTRCPHLPRKQAVDLRRACQTALNKFNRGDRQKGITVLENILEKIRMKA